MPSSRTVPFHAEQAGGQPLPSRRQDRGREASIDTLIAVLGILPLLLTAHLPLTDLPNHLARQYILRDWAGSPYLQTFYYVHWALVPNLALEIFVLAARQIVSIELAVRLFCISTVLMLFLGTRLVNRELSGGQARMYRVAPLLFFGGPFQYGFLSYCFGVGLALVLFGVYLRVRSRRIALLLPVLLASSFGLMLCHLAAFGLYWVAAGACELTFGWSAAGGATRRLPLALLRRMPLAVFGSMPVFLLFVWLSPTTGILSDNAIQFSSVHEKMRSLAAITFFTSPKVEVALLVLAAAGLAAGLLAGVIRFHRIGLTTVAVMLIVWLLLPAIAMGAAFIDYRMPWAIAFFLLAGLMPGPNRDRWATAIGSYFGVLVIARVVVIGSLWLNWEPTLGAIDQGLARLPVGSRVMVVQGRPPSGGVFRQPDLANVASYAVARRQAFEPGMFANLSGQILYFQPHFLALWEQGNFRVRIPSTLDSLPPDYNYVLVLLPNLARIAPGLPLTCRDSGPEFAILRALPPEAPASLRTGCPG